MDMCLRAVTQERYTEVLGVRLLDLESHQRTGLSLWIIKSSLVLLALL